MLMAHPAVLRPLLEEYYALKATEPLAASRRRLDDVRYTLCVATGTRRITDALAAAHAHLAGVLQDSSRQDPAAA